MSPFDLVEAQLAVHAVSPCVVCNGDFTCFFYLPTIVLVCPGYVRKLPTPGAGAMTVSC